MSNLIKEWKLGMKVCVIYLVAFFSIFLSYVSEQEHSLNLLSSSRCIALKSIRTGYHSKSLFLLQDQAIYRNLSEADYN